MAGEVHHIGERLDLDLPEVLLGAREPSPLTRVGGYLLLWTIIAMVCYSAAL